MTKRLIILLALALAVPFLFYGCSGDDGAAGPAGAPGGTGATGATGPPGTGIVADETCVLCHDEGKIKDVALAHRIGQTAGSMTVTINSVAFGAPVDNNVDVTVNFTFAATNSAGDNITNKIDLTTPASNTTALPSNSTDNLAYIRFSLAQLTPGVNGSPDEWGGFVVSPGATGSGPFSTANRDGINGAAFTYNTSTGVGSYTFRDNVIRTPEYKDNVVTRVFIQVSGVPITLFTSDPYFNAEGRRRPVANGLKDVVSGVGVQTAAPGVGYPVKTDVSTAACNGCHDPLAIHGGGRREYKACQVCHNAKLETLTTIENNGSIVTNDNVNLVNLIHKIHNSAGGSRFKGVQDIGNFALDEPIAYPQAINNCRTCHQGPAAADNTYDNFMNRPSRRACGSCHFKVDFAAGIAGGHPGGAYTNDSVCSFCHQPADILGFHAAKEGAPPTPNNPTLAGALKALQYGINSVSVDNTTATIKFWIKNLTDNVFLNLGNKSAGDNVTKTPAGFSGSPAFLFGYTMSQDGVSTPADYTNWGRIDSGTHAFGYAGQPQSVNIVGRSIVSNDNVAFSEYTVTVPNAFPSGAKMRAVALQGYFTQTSVAGIDENNDGVPDNVARHTPSVVKAVNGDTVRRTVVKSGYNATTGKPEGCLECHEVFEGHGGNRVNNVQVCVICHNANLSSSGRVIDPATLTSPTASDTAKAIVAKFGSDPLKYPEVTTNFKSLIHGLHAADMRVNEFQYIRGDRLALILGNEILFPGDLSHCTKCHVGTTYRNVLVENALLTTEKITTGDAGETRAQIIGKRDTVPNETDLVDSATTSACGYCHDTPTDVSHFRTMGGEVKSIRKDAKVPPPPLMPDVLATP